VKNGRSIVKGGRRYISAKDFRSLPRQGRDPHPQPLTTIRLTAVPIHSHPGRWPRANVGRRADHRPKLRLTKPPLHRAQTDAGSTRSLPLRTTRTKHLSGHMTLLDTRSHTQILLPVLETDQATRWPILITVVAGSIPARPPHRELPANARFLRCDTCKEWAQGQHPVVDLRQQTREDPC
jgi:hypothetical protein